jgi:hypothetical protein
MAEIRRGPIAIRVEIRDDPEGRPRVLLQLPDGFALLDGIGAIAVATMLVEAAEAIAARD